MLCIVFLFTIILSSLCRNPSYVDRLVINPNYDLGSEIVDFCPGIGKLK